MDQQMTDGIIGATTVSDAVNDSIEKKEPTRDIRQKDLIPPDRLEKTEAHVIGCGAIGRQVACMLSAMGVPTINLVDYDSIEVVNLGPQAWSTEYLGEYKVLAVAENLQMINSATDVKTHLSRWRTSMLDCKNTTGSVAVFCCVDSIETRKHIWIGNNPDINFWVDGRMAGEVLRVITAADRKSFMDYPSTLFSGDEAFTGACTTQSTVYSASLAAGLMVSQFAKWLRNAPIDNDLTFSIGSGELAPTITDPLIP